MRLRGFACACSTIAIACASIACPSKPPETAAHVAPSTSASASSAAPPPKPESVESQLQGAVYTYCRAYEDCTNQSNTPCDTMILQYIETGCAKQMLRYYDCADGSTCGDGALVTPDSCKVAYDAMDDCMSHKNEK